MSDEEGTGYEIDYMPVLELIWGKGFIAPGGEGNIDRIVEGVNLQGKSVLELGSGAGGGTLVLAGKYGARVTGIDIEPQLIERARTRAGDLGLDAQTDFHLVQPGPLQFPDQSFDVVISSGAFTQIENKIDTFRECLRVLKPGGVLSCYDWMKTAGEYSEDMLYWFKMEGLTYEMVTPGGQVKLLKSAGFVDVTVNDRSDWYKRKVREEYELIKNELYTRLVASMGKKDADHFVEDWRAMAVVCGKGEMLQVYCRGNKPV